MDDSLDILEIFFILELKNNKVMFWNKTLNSAPFAFSQ
jgi:hypothetical protein